MEVSPHEQGGKTAMTWKKYWKKPTTTETKTKVYRHKSLEGKTDRWRSDGQTDGHWGALQTQQKKVAMSCNCFEKDEKKHWKTAAAITFITIILTT